MGVKLIKFSPPDISQEEIDEVVDTLKSGWITTGPKTKLFESKIASYCKAERAVCLSSATAAMELTLLLLGIGKGDEVITSAYTYTASASVIAHVGAKIVLVDTDRDSYEMDYEKLANVITKKTKAIIAVDIAGRMCDYAKILDVIKRKQEQFEAQNDIQKAIGRIVVIADSAHAFGAKWNGKTSGEVADFTCFSFHAVKNLTTAEGGAVVWRNINGIRNDVIYTKYMLMSLHGQSKDALEKEEIGSWDYDIIDTFYKCNMTDIMASFGLAQFKRFPALEQRRREIVEKYEAGLKGLPISTLKHFGDGFCSSMHLYLTRLDGKTEVERNRFIVKMAEAGVVTNVHYKPLPMHTAYKKLGFNIVDFPNAYAMYQNAVSLPLHSLLTDEQVEYVISKVKLCLEEI